MPMRDKDGKPLSGWQKQKLRDQRAAQSAGTEGGGSPIPEGFKKLGPPPISDTTALITWGAQALALAMFDAMLDASLGAQERRRFVADCSGKLGLIQDKARVEQRLQRVVSIVEGKDRAGKLKEAPVYGQPRTVRADSIDRPATARGGARPAKKGGE